MGGKKNAKPNLTPAERVALARHAGRPGTAEFIDALFDDFFEMKGDRLCGEDGSVLGGVALFHGHPVTVIGHRKGRDLEEHLRYHFGMPSPEGYRKAGRLMAQAEKFMRPVITFIDRGIPYDPFAKKDPDIHADVSDRPIGGLGIFMTKKLMDEFSYEFRDGQNIMVLKKRLG